MAHELDGRKVAIIAADMVERVELTKPRQALDDAGAQTTLVSIKPGEIRSFDHFDPSEAFSVQQTIDQARPEEYDAVFIPGGVGNPDQLRADKGVVNFVRQMHLAGKPIGAICHGPWVLVEAGLARGRTLTSWPTLHTDIENAGGSWIDQEVVKDGQVLTSRGPDDLPAYTKALVEHFAAR
ncbi:MAG: type 1 glutamine amidotransferase [Actinomycetota bacterium]|nr:type 1 glutamine amidotransferase [Actinomycetota bacterium]